MYGAKWRVLGLYYDDLTKPEIVIVRPRLALNLPRLAGFAELALKAARPIREVGRHMMGRPEEREQRGIGIPRGANGVVRQ